MKVANMSGGGGQKKTTPGLQKSAGDVKSPVARMNAKPMRGQAGPTPQTTRPTPQTTRPTPQRKGMKQDKAGVSPVPAMTDQLLSKQYSLGEKKSGNAGNTIAASPKRRMPR